MERQQAPESSAVPADCPRAYGFLTAVDSPVHGIFGGYLLVDPLGRPLEFHCTAPVKESRAQQILYGTTLHGHLHGQQIGGTLLAGAGLQPDVVLTDVESMLHVRPHTQLPVVLVATAAAVTSGNAATAVGDASVQPHTVDAPRQEELLARIRELAIAIDIREPFERIRAAIDEAQRH